MATKPKSPGRRGLAVSLYPLKPEQAISAMFKTSKAEVERIVGKGKKKTPRK
jgi:hypothetical protein